jgi:hypothetical protein
MEDNSKKVNLQDDVLQSDHHSTLSAEAVAKALQRHNREHKGDADKAARKVVATAKKH